MGKEMKLFWKKAIILMLLVPALGTLILAQDELVKANDLFLAGKYQEAKAIIEPIVEKDPNYTGAVFLLGRICFKLGDLNRAKELIDKAIELDLANPDYRNVRNEMATFASKLTEASRLSNNADYEGSKKIWLEVLNDNPNFVNAYIELGRVLVHLGDLENAAANFQKAIAKDPGNESYKQEFEALTKRYIQDGVQLMQRRSYSTALEKFKQAISLNPDDAQAYYFSAIVYLDENKLAEALLSVNKSLELDSSYPKAFLVKGKILAGMNNIDEAIKQYKKAIELDSEYIDAWKNLGLVYYKMKNFDEAIPIYLQVIKLQPDYASAYANLGAVYIEQKKYNDAITVLIKASELNPNDYASIYRLSQAYNNIGKCDKAKESAEKALKIKPNWAPVLIELGIAERCLGNRTAAKQAFQIAARDPKWTAVANYELKTVQ
jgi:tetratricopeptide (TPR) repeat protein